MTSPDSNEGPDLDDVFALYCPRCSQQITATQGHTAVTRVLIRPDGWQYHDKLHHAECMSEVISEERRQASNHTN